MHVTREELHEIITTELIPTIDKAVLLTPGIKDDIAWAILKRTVLSEAVLDRIFGKLKARSAENASQCPSSTPSSSDSSRNTSST